MTVAATTVRVRRDGAVAHVTLDRPPVNVLTAAMLEELDGCLCEAGEDRGAKVIVLEGAGKAFCAGVDVADHTETRVQATLEVFHRVARRLLAMPQPVIAAVHGAALGGGMELALACDVVLARDDAKFGQPEIQLGVFPPVAAALLPRLVGRQRAMDLILTGRTVPAAEAAQLGLVSQVLPADGFAAAVDGRAAQLASLSGAALKLAKRAMIAGFDTTADLAIARAESLYLTELVAEPDAHEGIAAFLEKRQPRWRS